MIWVKKQTKHHHRCPLSADLGTDINWFRGHSASHGCCNVSASSALDGRTVHTWSVLLTQTWGTWTPFFWVMTPPFLKVRKRLRSFCFDLVQSRPLLNLLALLFKKFMRCMFVVSASKLVRLYASPRSHLQIYAYYVYIYIYRQERDFQT